MTRQFNIPDTPVSPVSSGSHRRVSSSILGLTTSIMLSVSSCVGPTPVSQPHPVQGTQLPTTPHIPIHPLPSPVSNDLSEIGQTISDTVRDGVGSVLDFSKEIVDRFSKRITIATSPDSRLLDTLWVEEFPVTVTFSGTVVDREELSSHDYFLWRIEKKESTGVFSSSYEEIVRSQGDSFVFTLEEDGVYRVLLTSVGEGDTPVLYTTSLTIRKNIL